MKIAICGLGNFGTRWLERVLKYDPDCIVQAISRKSVKDINSLDVLNNRSRLILSNTCPEAEVDLSIICTPAINEARKDLICDLANKSKFLLIEKPISNSYQSSKFIIDYIEKTSCKFMVGYQYRFHDLITHSQKLVENNINIKEIKINHQTNMANWHR